VKVENVHEELSVQVWDADMASDDLIAEAKIFLRELLDENYNGWYDL